MVSFHAPISFEWRRPFNLDGLFHRDELKQIVDGVRSLPLCWRWASAGDWPKRFGIARDFRHARGGGYGFVADLDTDRLFLVPRGWAAPEWGLARYNLKLECWRDLGDLEPTPEHWIFPALEERLKGVS